MSIQDTSNPKSDAAGPIDLRLITSFLAKTQYKIHENQRISALTGENFNIFRILGLEAAEVRTHSAFLSELLNPKGSHSQGDLFLGLFLDQLHPRPRFKASGATVIPERNIGPIDDAYTRGGRIDIWLDDGEQRIFIENKIYAGDQWRQLERYHNEDPSAILIYLTLDGCEAETSLTASQYKRLSYKEHLLEWLEKCRKEAVMLPSVRDALTHYINLIRYLTNQTLSMTTNQEIKNEILTHPEYAEALIESYTALGQLFWEAWSHFQSKLDVRLSFEPIQLANGAQLRLIYAYDSRDGFYTGYALPEQIDVETAARLKEILRRVSPDMESNDVWIGWHSPEGFTPKQKFEQIDAKKRIEFLTKPESLEAFVNAITAREQRIYTEFVSEMRNADLLLPPGAASSAISAGPETIVD